VSSTARRAGFVFAVAFAVRLGAAAFMPQGADDSTRYLTLAENLAAHGVYSAHPDASKPTMDDAPLYPLVLVVFMWAFGKGALALRVPGVIFGSAAASLAMLLGRELTRDERMSLAAGLAVALLPSLVGASTLVLSEGLYACALTGAMLLYVKAWKRAAVRPPAEGGAARGARLALGAGVAGAVLGVAALVRPVAAGFFLVGGAGLVVRSWVSGGSLGRGAVRGAAYAVSFWLVMSPWVIRNYAACGRFVPLTTRGPGQLWVGSYEPSGGRHTDEAYAAYQRRAGELAPDEIKAEAVARIAAHPVRWSGWGLRKVANVWLGLPGGERLLRGRKLLAAVAWVPDLVVVALAAVALLLIFMRGAPCGMGAGAVGLYLATETAAYFALLGLARFRVPMMPMAVVLAAVTAEALLARGCGERARVADGASPDEADGDDARAAPVAEQPPELPKGDQAQA